MSAAPLALVGCGAAKLGHRAPAGQLYTGQHYRACMAAALACVPPAQIRIVSALHGLVRPDQELDPYDVTLGQPGAVTAGVIARQAIEQELTAFRPVALCGRAYAELIGVVWGNLVRPLAGLSIGRQRHELSVIRQRGTLWP